MILPTSRIFVVAVLLATGLGAGTLRAAEPAIIAKARAQIGSEDALNSLTSIHYVGNLVGPDPANPGKEVRQGIEIFLEKPARQRIVVSSPTVIELSALDGYDGWRRTIDAKDPSKWQQSQLGADQVRQLRADVWQNLAFFRGLERNGGSVEDQGPATIDGIACEKIAFFHSPTLVYYRYFNRATGDLVYTGTAGNNIREEGEMVVAGIHFPKKILISQTANGQTIKRTITFEKITVNEKLSPDLFRVPLPTVK